MSIGTAYTGEARPTARCSRCRVASSSEPRSLWHAGRRSPVASRHRATAWGSPPGHRRPTWPPPAPRDAVLLGA